MTTRRDVVRLTAAGLIPFWLGINECWPAGPRRVSAAQADESVDQELGPFPFLLSESRIGFFDRSGAVVVEPTFLAVNVNSTRYFSDGLALVFEGKDFFSDVSAVYIDTTGEIQISTTYASALHFSDGLAAVQDGDLWGYIDTNGMLAIEPQFSNIDHYDFSFAEGFAAVSENRNFGYIDKSGAITIPMMYENALPFSEGLAAVASQESRDWGYVDQSGSVVIDFGFDSAGQFSEGLAFAQSNNEIRIIDTAGNFVGDETFQASLESFREGLACVVPSDKSAWGYVDTSGTMAIEAVFDGCAPFTEGMGAVMVDGLWGFIDHNGDTKIDPQFREAFRFSGGVALVIDTDGMFGLVDTEGQVVMADI